jgi:CRISPR/Cas system endoribonuclease Cas6 (RAMP superfamily)
MLKTGKYRITGTSDSTVHDKELDVAIIDKFIETLIAKVGQEEAIRMLEERYPIVKAQIEKEKQQREHKLRLFKTVSPRKLIEP